LFREIKIHIVIPAPTRITLLVKSPALAGGGTQEQQNQGQGKQQELHRVDADESLKKKARF